MRALLGVLAVPLAVWGAWGSEPLVAGAAVGLGAAACAAGLLAAGRSVRIRWACAALMAACSAAVVLDEHPETLRATLLGLLGAGGLGLVSEPLLRRLPRQRSVAVGVSGIVAASLAAALLLRRLPPLELPTGGGGAPLAAAWGLLGVAFVLRGVELERRRVVGPPAWLSLAAAGGVLLLALLSHRALVQQNASFVRAAVRSAAPAVGGGLLRVLEPRVQSLERMAARWDSRGGMPRDEWEADARNYVADQPGYRGIVLVSGEGAPPWTVAAEEVAPASILELWERTRARSAAEPGRTALFTAAAEGDEHVLVVRTTLGADGGGCLVGFFSVERMLTAVGGELVLGLSLAVVEEGTILHRGGDEALRSPYGVVTERITLRNLDWTIEVWPGPWVAEAKGEALPLAPLWAGPPLALLVGLVVHFARGAALRSHEVERKHEALAREVEQRTQAERELRTLNDTLAQHVEARTRDLRRSNEALEQFAYAASHDLKEPLRGIQTYAHFLVEDHGDRLAGGASEKVDAILRLSRRLQERIESLLRYSRAGCGDLERRWVDLDDVVQEVLDDLRASLDQRGVEVEVERPLPEVRCDRARLSEVLRNLVANAAIYNEGERKWITIGRRRSEDGDDGPLFVADNGIGIREDQREDAFQIFRRLNGDRFPGGTGVGLTTSRRIVERHGGRLWVEPREGGGSVFCIEFEKKDFR